MPKQTKADRALAAAIQELAVEDQVFEMEQIHRVSRKLSNSDLRMLREWHFKIAPRPTPRGEVSWQDRIDSAAVSILSAQHTTDCDQRMNLLWHASSELLDNERKWGGDKKVLRKLELLTERLESAHMRARDGEVSLEEAKKLTRVVSKIWDQLANG